MRSLACRAIGPRSETAPGRFISTSRSTSRSCSTADSARSPAPVAGPMALRGSHTIVAQHRRSRRCRLAIGRSSSAAELVARHASAARSRTRPQRTAPRSWPIRYPTLEPVRQPSPTMTCCFVTPPSRSGSSDLVLRIGEMPHIQTPPCLARRTGCASDQRNQWRRRLDRPRCVSRSAADRRATRAVCGAQRWSRRAPRRMA